MPSCFAVCIVAFMLTKKNALINCNCPSPHFLTQIPRLIKVEQADTPYFRIVSPDNVGHKVAPGCASIFRIIFTPDEQRDYQHEAICITEREKFVVPICAIGARPLLDFPDELYFQVRYIDVRRAGFIRRILLFSESFNLV